MTLKKPSKVVWDLLKMALCLLIFFQWEESYGQILKFDYDEYNTKNGLSQNNIVCVAQDKQGFMWFGTEEGLNRFDGFEFKVIKHIEGDSNTIISNEIRALYVDDDGSILIGTNVGVCRYFPSTEKVQHYKIDYTSTEKMHGGYVSGITRRDKNSIWISYLGSGIDVLSKKTKVIDHYSIFNGLAGYTLQNDHITSMVFLPDGKVMIGSYGGLQAIGKDGKVLSPEQLKKSFPWKDSIDKTIKSILVSKDQKNIWIGTEIGGLYKVDVETNSVENFNIKNSQLTSNDIITIFEDSQENVWFGSDAAYIFDKKENQVKWFNQNKTLVKNHTNFFLEDKDRNFWMGTTRLGIRKINHQDSEIKHFVSVKSDEVLAMNEDLTGKIWIGAAGAGLFRMWEDQKGFDEAEANSKLISKSIKKILRDRDGNFWMGSWDGGLMKYNPFTKALEQFGPSLGNFPSHHVWDIQQDKTGNLWLGTLRDGLCYYKVAENKFEYFTTVIYDTTTIANNDILSLLYDSRDILWIGTGNGLSVRFPGATTFDNQLKFEGKGKKVLSSHIIISILEDQEGKIWLGTKGGGINIIKVNGNHLEVERIIKEKDGLPSNTITSIEKDNNGNIWISTINGLAKINSRDFSIMEIPPSVALRGVEFLERASFKSSDGRLFFGCGKGFYVFSPDRLKLKNDPIEVVLTGLTVVNEDISPNRLYNGRKILDESINDLDVLNLSYKDYAFSISFSPLKFHLQDNLSYAYFLENLDKEWQYIKSDKRFVHYTNLAPGEYTLKIKASYDGINWPKEAKTLKIVIAPPWYSSMWFRIVALLIVIGIILTIHRARIKFLAKQSRRLEELVVIRTKELDNSNKEIQKLLHELEAQKANVENKNNELEEANEEVKAQRDHLARKSFELEKAQFELKKINFRLEELVEKRTEILNDTLHELETFLYRASHDLQGPISSMRGIISLMKIDGPDPSSSENKYYELLEASVGKLDQTLRKLMEKYAIEKTNITYELLTNESLKDMINDVVKDIKSFRREDFEVNIEQSIHFYTDKALLSSILRSLLENAFFFSENSQSKKVNLNFKTSGDKLLFSVTDHGTGIKEEYREKIFMMFFRGSELSKGNGLGLYLVKCALEKIEGNIEVESEEGSFSKFNVVLFSPNR